jgi:hypothetical protein
MISQQTLDLVAAAQPYLMIIGAGYIAFTLVKFATKMSRGESASGTLGSLMVGAAMVALPNMFPSLVKVLGTLFGRAEPTSNPPAPEPPHSPAPASASADLSWIPGVLAVAGAVAVLAAIGVGLYHYYSKSLRPSFLKRRSEALAAATLVSEARKTLEWVVLASASYETDLAKHIDYPMMTDVSEPLVGKYIREMRHAQELERTLMKTPLREDAERFSTAVTDLKVSYEAAVRQAEKIRWSNFTVAEQKRLRDARTALSIIQDASTTPEQRNAQYRRISKLLDGLIVLTAPVRLSLSAWVPMLVLEAGAHEDQVAPRAR